jgi:hypothetical protein
LVIGFIVVYLLSLIGDFGITCLCFLDLNDTLGFMTNSIAITLWIEAKELIFYFPQKHHLHHFINSFKKKKSEKVFGDIIKERRLKNMA